MTQEDFDELSSKVDFSYVYGTIAFIFALVCFILPFRSIINHCNTDEGESDDRSYIQVCHKFQSDYDRENPLTKQRGIQRLLNIQLDQAEKDNDDEKMQQIQNEKAEALKENIGQSMLRYTMKNEDRKAAYA